MKVKRKVLNDNPILRNEINSEVVGKNYTYSQQR